MYSVFVPILIFCHPTQSGRESHMKNPPLAIIPPSSAAGHFIYCLCLQMVRLAIREEFLG
ncbi:MAG TPA: hypothetical protein DD706_20785 [Nitrospiraceae bacterium]|nr:hypothetical protein [Nitrospiraceae bacterium]